MRLKDVIRFVVAKALFKKTVLFSKHPDWERLICNTIKDTDYIPFFYEFDEITPDPFDVVVPLTIRAQQCINSHFPYINGTKALIPPDPAIDLCSDKETFFRHLVSMGFEDLVPHTSEKLDHPADAYTTHIIINNERIVFSKTLKFSYDQEYFLNGSQSKQISTEPIDHTHLSDIFERILNDLDYQGICCFNYRLSDGKVKIFEVNPRYGASLTDFLTDALPLYEDTVRTTALSAP